MPRPRPGRRTALALVLAAVLLGAAGLVAAVVAGGDGAPAGEGAAAADPLGHPGTPRRGGEARTLYRIPAPRVPRAGVDIPGFWVRDGYVVKTVRAAVVAYADDGAEKWRIPLPHRICAAPRTETGGKAVIAYQGGAERGCDRITLIDLVRGVKLWDRPVPGPGGGHPALHLAQSGDLVGLAWIGGSGLVRIGDGGQIAAEEPGPVCSVQGFAGGAALLRSYTCGDGTARLQRLDTATGAVAWTYPLRGGYTVDRIYSTSPVVVAVRNERTRRTAVLSLTERGERRAVLDLGRTEYLPRCPMDLYGSDVDGCQGVAATADTCYLPTAMDRHGGGLTNQIHAFDLRTGRRRWAVRAPGRLLYPLGTQGRALLAYQAAGYDRPGAVVRIGPGGGRPSTVLRHPTAARHVESGFYSARYAYRDGRFYLASDRLTGSGADETLLVAFGP
ncbi:hypothetical protein ACZ90_61830 [Streptomyces albus subsp. albus]|nr:hypothetical protein ACZ90_61830 [Streptomyces albus subsp. albus]